MLEWVRRFLYRIFCVIALIVSVYLTIDFLISGTFDYRVLTMFLLVVVTIVWGILDWRKNYLVIRQQERELKLYQMYIQPLEELVKDIRARQHEFDNHLNAILNMHLTIDDYSELVRQQSAYITEAVRENDMRQYLPLLKISDKVLAGFLYSKIMAQPDYVRTDLEVQSLEIISGVSEHCLIEIVGILADNAYEACTEERNHVVMRLDSRQDKIIFQVKNQVQKLKLEDIGKFFEKGYSTKGDGNQRGLGLYRARMLADRYGGEITVGTESVDEKEYICFQVEI